MKKHIPIFISVFIIFCSLNLKAQDTIVKITGEKVIAKIIEITPTEVKYKKIEFIDGPTYVDYKSKIEFIVFSNGLKEFFEKKEEVKIVQQTEPTDYFKVQAPKYDNKIQDWGSKYRYQNISLNEKGVHSILLASNDKKIIGLVGQAKDAKNLQYIGFAGIPLGISSYFFFLRSLIYANTSQTGAIQLRTSDLTISAVCLAGAIACPVISGVARKNRKNYTAQAIKKYNEKF
ncbi:MAG: hypothetical protein JNL69_10295 [Bacteroidia bacterium]|nr:hypothetical protein [Bacteroidia bacterium]